MKWDNFTAGRIAAFRCKAGSKQTIFWDGKTPGLGIRVMATGTKSFIFETSLNGKTIRITIGDVATWTIPDAQAKATGYKAQTDNGSDPREVKAAATAAGTAAKAAAASAELREAVTLSQVWPLYIAARTPKWGKRHLADHIKMMQPGGAPRVRSKAEVTKPAPLASLSEVRLVDLTMERIAAWAEIEAAARPTSARLALRMLKAFLNWCQDHPSYKGIHPTNPARSQKAREVLGKPGVKRDSLQREQLPGWFAAVRLLQNPVMAAYLQTLLLTGARPGEILVMRWEDVNTRWKGLTIRDKVEGEREIPLTPYVASLLATLPRRSDWVFSNPKRGHITSPNYQLNAVCNVAGIEDLTLHGLRRSFKSLCEWLAIPAGVVAQIQGHKPSATIEKHYTHRPLDLLRVHHEAIEAWILEQAGVDFVPAPAGLRVVAAAGVHNR
jgi:integrase